jgi:Uncharacterized signal transduction histidine kinase domain (DUF2222).
MMLKEKHRNTLLSHKYGSTKTDYDEIWPARPRSRIHYYTNAADRYAFSWLFYFSSPPANRKFHDRQGTSVIEPLAIASEYGLTRSSREDLRRLISTSHRRNSPLIKSIAIFTKDNNLFVTSNFHRDFMEMRLPDGKAIPELTSVEHLDDYIILRTPILAENSLSETSLQSSSTPCR